MLNIAIGYDPSEALAAQVLAHSIRRNASKPVAIMFLMLEKLRHLHKRERDPKQSTDFSFTRFLTPALFSFSGHSLYLDCDMLVLDDVYKLVEGIPPWRFLPVSVVKHNHKPANKTKMLGAEQTIYERKNWSSFMLFWAGHKDTARLSPEYVDSASGLDLHQFKWIKNGGIGSLPSRWNWLVGYDPIASIDNISCLHWTEGGPWWDRYINTPYADLWFQEKERMEQVYERIRKAS